MGQPFHEPTSGPTFRGTLSGDGRPGPIEERLGRRLIRLIDPESDEGMRLLSEGRVDLLVANRLVVELKTVETRLPIHVRQTLCYLSLMQLPLGLILNFQVSLMRDGVRRVIKTDSIE